MKPLFFAPIATCAIGLFLTVSSLWAEPLAAGAMIPATTVKNSVGKELQLRALVADKPAVLIFYRGGWCPFCMRHLAALAEIQDDVVAAGYQLLAISADQPSKLAETPDLAKLNYTLLSDDTMATAKAFGLTFQVPDDLVAKYKSDYKIDLEAASGETHHLLPHPAVYVVDRSGKIQFTHVNEDYKLRLDPAKILAVIRKK